MEQELAQKRQELVELQNQASDTRVFHTSTRRSNKRKVLNEEQKHQLTMLHKVYERCIPITPIFKYYHASVPDGMVPYISFSDLRSYNFNIRVLSAKDFFNEDTNTYEKKKMGR